MKLYKIIKMVGDHGVSVFPPEGQELPEASYFVPYEWNANFRRLRVLGLTDIQAGQALKAWEWHARYTLKLGAEGTRAFVRRCVGEAPPHVIPPPPIFWSAIIAIAVIVAVALGLYLWVFLDQELNVTFGAHKWAYVMSYQERLWRGEILNVGAKQMGYYEQSPLFGDVVASHDRSFGGVFRHDWIWFKPGSMVLEGRRIIFYHIYRFSGFFVHFCGVMTKVGVGIYKLLEGGNDPFKPTGIWSRPGGRWGTPEYEGCWGEWWWL